MVVFFRNITISYLLTQLSTFRFLNRVEKRFSCIDINDKYTRFYFRGSTEVVDLSSVSRLASAIPMNRQRSNAKQWCTIPTSTWKATSA